jgi:DNA repair exonuclease SbcCD nuclease subunit
MKLLFFADLHLDAAFVGARPAIADGRRRSLRQTLARIVDLAAAENVDALLCAGDLYEQERVTADTAEFVRSTFEAANPLPIFISPGNHDWLGTRSLYAHVRWSPNVKIFAEERLQPVSLQDGLTLWGAAHLGPSRTDGFLDSFHADREGVNVALFHGSERGSIESQGPGSALCAPFWSSQIEEAGLNHVFAGHQHPPMDGERLTYPGNPDPLGFGETGRRGAVLVTVGSDGQVTTERHVVAQSEVHDVDVDLSGCASPEDVRQRVADQVTELRGTARVTLHGEVPPEVEVPLGDLGELAPLIGSLDVRLGDLRIGYDLESFTGEQTVRGQFVRDVFASELPDDARRRVLTTGLRALAARRDLGVG